MTTHSIYNKSLETNMENKPHTSRKMTPEEMERLNNLTRQTHDSVGTKIQKVSFTPYKTTEQKAEAKARETLLFEPTVKELNEVSPPGRKPTFPHVDKEFIEVAFAAGKTVGQIERENGMQQGTLYSRMNRWKIANPNAKKVAEVEEIVKTNQSFVVHSKPETEPEVMHETVESVQEADDTIKPSWRLFDAPKEDLINNPSHYTSGGIETIDYLQAKLTSEEFSGFLKGNVIKYLSREKHKGGIDDLRKAQWYLNRLVSE